MRVATWISLLCFACAARAQVSAAMTHLRSRDFRAAEPLLRAACAANEKDGCYLHARTLFSLDRYEPSLAALERIRDADPWPWRVDGTIGEVREAMGLPADAERAFQRAVAGNKDETDVPRLAYGRFLVRQGRADEALGPLESVAKQFPKGPLARYELGRAYYHLGRLADAERELMSAPELESARLLLAKVRRQLQSGRP